MSTAANSLNRLPFHQADPGFRKFLIYSLILHVCLVLSIVASIYLHILGPNGVASAAPTAASM